MADVLNGIEAGASPKAFSRPATKGEYGVLKVSAVTWQEFRPQENKALPAEFNVSGIPTVSKGDLLLSRANTTELLASPVIAGDDHPNLILSDKTLRLVPRTEVADSRFLLYALRQREARRFFASNATGTSGSMRNVSQAAIRRCPIPVPPLAEQKRIAGILDAADALRAKRREALAQLDTLLQSTFLDMFGDPVTNPMGWEECTVGDVTNCIVPGRDKPKSFTGSTPWITTDDLVDLAVTSDSPKGIGLSEEEIAQVRARVIPKGSVIISCVGDLGISSIAGRDLVVNQQLHTFQCGDRINAEFVTFCLPFRKPWMKRRATQTTLPYLNKTNCNSIPIIVPPLDLQHRFAVFVDQVEQQKARMHTHLTELDALFASLQSRAFNGEL